MSKIEELQEKILLLESEIMQLKQKLAFYYERDANEEKSRLKQERVELISSTLFPTYNLHSNDKPPHYPGLGWWNEAEIIEWYDNIDGGVHLKVKSYVGGGNYEDFQCDCPASWMTVDNPVPLIHRWIQQKEASLIAAKKRTEVAQAKAEIERAKNKLKLLGE